MSGCIPCSKFCGDCVGSIACSYCLPGAYLDNSYACIKCPVDNCYNCNMTSLITNNTNYCSLCFNGYYLNS